MAPSETRFAQALAAHLFAERRLNGLPQDAASDECSLISEAYSACAARLIETPATTLSDLRAKIEVIWQDREALPTPETILAVMRDLHALTAHEPSRVFDAAAWLGWFERCGGGWVMRDDEVVLVVPDHGYRSEKLEQVMFELNSCDGGDAVRQLIRGRSQPTLAA